nr:unnamed protein product [Haemonchus contortus]
MAMVRVSSVRVITEKITTPRTAKVTPKGSRKMVMVITIATYTVGGEATPKAKNEDPTMDPTTTRITNMESTIVKNTTRDTSTTTMDTMVTINTTATVTMASVMNSTMIPFRYTNIAIVIMITTTDLASLSEITIMVVSQTNADIITTKRFPDSMQLREFERSGYACI